MSYSIKNYPFIMIFTLREKKAGSLQIKKIPYGYGCLKKYLKINFSLASNEYKKDKVSQAFCFSPLEKLTSKPSK